jgi:hypothetical protein
VECVGIDCNRENQCLLIILHQVFRLMFKDCPKESFKTELIFRFVIFINK